MLAGTGLCVTFISFSGGASLWTSRPWHRRFWTSWMHLLILGCIHLRGGRKKNPSSFWTPPTTRPSLWRCTSRVLTAEWVDQTLGYTTEGRLLTRLPLDEGPARLVWGRTAEGQRGDQLHFSDGFQEMYCPYPIRPADWGDTHTHTLTVSLCWNVNLQLWPSPLTFSGLDEGFMRCHGCSKFRLWKLQNL